MSAPKSVVKITKQGVQYTSSCDKAQYYIYELSRAAMRDVGRFIAKKMSKAYYEAFRKKSGEAGKATKYRVIAGKKTQYPRVQIGLKSSQTKGFYSYFQEFGSSKTKKLGLLSGAVESSIPEIIRIESQYLSGLGSEAQALAQISEQEYEGGAYD